MLASRSGPACRNDGSCWSMRHSTILFTPHPMARPQILIVSPASARENNGNWQTASRWMRHLATHARVAIAPAWDAGRPAPELLIALHARRSAASLAAFSEAHPGRPSLLVLTGTDLYRDIHL